MKEIKGSRQDLIGKACRIFLRERSEQWWVSIKFPKKPRVYRSLKTTDPSLAHKEAIELYQSFQKRLDTHGDIAIEKTSTLTNIYERFCLDDPTSKRSGTWRADLIEDHIKNKWMPYLGKQVEVKATIEFEDRLKLYVGWRRGKPTKYRRKGYKPSNNRRAKAGKSTLKLEYQSLSQVMRHAHKTGLIDRLPGIDFKSMNLDWSQQDTTKTRRASFTTEELQSLPALLDQYINEEKFGYRSNHRWARERLKACVLLMASSGLRPSEMRNLRNRDLIFEEHKGKEILVLKIGRSKGGTKTVPHNSVSQFMGDSSKPVQWMKHWMENGMVSNAKTAFVFASKTGEVPRMTISHHFREFLIRNKMVTDKEFGKKRRSLYSLRHAVITDLLKRNVPINIIARSVGSSPAVLYASYDHNDIEEMKDLFIQ